MRDQQTPVIRENVFFPEIEPLSAHSFQPSRHLEKSAASEATMCITATGRGPAHSSIHQQQVRAVCESASNQRECAREKSLLAQPAFVLDKKERPFKRHAGDLVLKAEHGLCVYEKRLRSSSFTFRPSSSSSETGLSVSERRVRSSSFSLLTAFPPNQPALKNNVFMPSSLLQERTQRNNRDLEEKLDAWSVIKPATLQPPQISLPLDSESAQTRTEEKQSLEGKSNTLVNNPGPPKSAHGSTCILAMETRSKMQPFDQTSYKYTADFVFGENMEKRVMSPKRPTASPTSISLCRRESTSTRLSYNRNWPYQKHRLHASLIESAAAYTARPRMKYELDQVEVVTGEESERNVLQISCRIFVFNKENQVWTERGRGYLRLNDTAASDNGPFRSRIVMRNHGNLKLILNSKIFNEMKLEKANRKSLRITATDLTDNSVKIFLVQASVKDAGRLYAAIHHRLIAMKNFQAQREQNAPNAEDAKPSYSQLLNSDSENEEDDEMMLYPSKMSDHLQLIRQRPVLYS